MVGPYKGQTEKTITREICGPVDWPRPWICPGCSKKHTNLMERVKLTMQRGSVGM